MNKCFVYFLIFKHALGYENNERGEKNTSNRRNGYSHKSVNTAYGRLDVSVPRDREGSFEPKAIPKHTKDISGTENKVLSMYARRMNQRNIADTVKDIYGFDIFHGTIPTITDRVTGTAEEWQNRPLKNFYTSLFVDCICVTIQKEMAAKNCAVYIILSYDADGRKDVLGLWVGEPDGKHYLMQIFDEIRSRGIFKDVIMQKCIVHLM